MICEIDAFGCKECNNTCNYYKEEEVMNAKDARLLAIEKMKTTLNEKEFKKVLDKIEKSARNGHLNTSIEVAYPSHDYTFFKLNELGYDFDVVFERFNIKW